MTKETDVSSSPASKEIDSKSVGATREGIIAFCKQKDLSRFPTAFSQLEKRVQVLVGE